MIIVVVGVAGFREVKNQKDIHLLRNQVAFVQETEKKYDQPDGATTTTNWSVASDQELHFSLKYPSSWTTNDSGLSPIEPKRLVGNSQNNYPLALTTSSNLAISPTWKQIALASGEPAYYSFEQNFDFYYIVNEASMLIWTIPVRSHDGLLTNQELNEATQIINTYRRESST